MLLQNHDNMASSMDSMYKSMQAVAMFQRGDDEDEDMIKQFV